MTPASKGARRTSRAAWVSLLVVLSAACGRPPAETPPWELIEPWHGWLPGPTASPSAVPTSTPDLLNRLLPPTRVPGSSVNTPTPDPLRPVPTPRTESVWYVVQAGDSISGIAERFGIGPHQLQSANGVVNPNVVGVGQLLEVPPPIVAAPGPSVKIIPDSGLVYGPASAVFDLNRFVGTWASYLNAYHESVEGVELSGPGIVQLVAQRYSLDPQLLLVVLEDRSGWVRSSSVAADSRVYPLGYVAPGSEGLFSQLSWAADQLNRGYYRWRAGWPGPFVFDDGRQVPAGPGINAGTAGIEALYAKLMPVEAWMTEMEGGLAALYTELFGDPFELAIDPLVPADLAQPEISLPFESGATWSFTGGPHSAWGAGSAWAALDFAPPGFALGCVLSDEWITAVTNGLILRSDNGEVMQDLDGDGLEQTGWAVLYLHVETRDRVQSGARVSKGDRIGHPSCEGGVTTGIHLHLARKYNGEWISADGAIPFLLDGWVSAGMTYQYDGTLSRDGVVLEAYDGRNDRNQVAR